MASARSDEYVEPIILIYSRLDRPTYYMWPFGVITLRGLVALGVGSIIGFLVAFTLFRYSILLAFMSLIFIPGIMVVYAKKQTWPPLEKRILSLISYLFAPKKGKTTATRPPTEITVRAGEGGFIDFVYPVPWPDGTVVSVYIHDRRVMRTRVVNGEVYVRAITPTRNKKYLVRIVAGKKKVIKFWIRVI